MSPGIIGKPLFQAGGKMGAAVSLALMWSLGGWSGHASLAHEVTSDRVSIAVGQGQVFGITSREGIARLVLGAGEQVVARDAKGVTGFVQTTSRLLGFSGELQRWVSINLSSSEKVLRWTVTPRMVIVQGQEATYGFQSDRGRWKREPWSAGETLHTSEIGNFIAVMVTNRRAVGFSAVTGGFFPQDLPVGNPILDIDMNDHIAILHLSYVKYVFRSGLSSWAELP